MGMHWEGYNELGLLIPKEELTEFIEKYNQTHTGEHALESLADVQNFENMEGCRSNFQAIYLSEEEYSGISILPLYGGGWFPVYDEALVILSGKSDAAYNIFEHGFYDTPDELIDEMKDKVGDYLPSDFDYERWIGDISYALFA